MKEPDQIYQRQTTTRLHSLGRVGVRADGRTDRRREQTNRRKEWWTDWWTRGWWVGKLTDHWLNWPYARLTFNWWINWSTR